MNDTTDNRRAFHRIFFATPVTVIKNDTPHKVPLIDISLNGALISRDRCIEKNPMKGTAIVCGVIHVMCLPAVKLLYLFLSID